MRKVSHGRREFFGKALLAPAAGAVVASALSSHTNKLLSAEQNQPIMAAPKLRYCLNMSTINSSKVPLREQLKIAAEAGYDGVELWLRDIEQFNKSGGDLVTLRKEIDDLGLQVESAIAFGKWIVNDPKERAAGLEMCKRDMELIRALGGRLMAAPPAGATQGEKVDLNAAVDRYRALLEIGRARDVIPQVELWGFSKNLSTLSEVLYVAAGANHPDSCILLDVYHLYKGGSDFSNISLVPGAKMHVLHMNDYPSQPPRAEIQDADRVYPGDGVAPLPMILRTLAQGGFAGVLSLELFNPTYWKQDPREVAKTGLSKMRAAVSSAF